MSNTFENLGQDILLKLGHLSGEKLARILADFEEAPFGRIPIQNAPENVQKYFSGSEGPDIYWVTKGCELDSLLLAEVGAIARSLSEIYRGIGITGDEGYRFNRYSPGQSYKLHVDRSALSKANSARYVSLILNLNNEYEGGEIHFPRQELKVKLGVGDLLVFPSCYTHPHEVIPIQSGVRKSIVSWLN
jgi:alkylated DNA repair dioxygenase AlkB